MCPKAMGLSTKANERADDGYRSNKATLATSVQQGRADARSNSATLATSVQQGRADARSNKATLAVRVQQG
jgi:hypothetical protein